jgi:uncharacterized membrane protein
MQAVGDAHETLRRMVTASWGLLSAVSTDQLVPFHASAMGHGSEPFCSYPTAVQAVAEGHETLISKGTRPFCHSFNFGMRSLVHIAVAFVVATVGAATQGAANAAVAASKTEAITQARRISLPQPSTSRPAQKIISLTEMGQGRLEAFSDGVIAVAITLLALGWTVSGPGHGPLLHQLGQRWPSFAAYLVSFFPIGVVWVNHHDMLRTVVVVDRLLLFVNPLLLLFVVPIPFATSTMAEYIRVGGTDAHVAAALYAAVLLGMGLGFMGLFELGMVPGRATVVMPPHARRRARLRFSAGSVSYLVAFGLAFVNPILTLVISGLVVTYYIARRTPGDGDVEDRTVGIDGFES